jgi:hypothetical protein
MYWTIWLALLLFAAGEVGRPRQAPWAWPSWAAGVVLTAIHIAVAMAVAHGWSHDLAVAATARATEARFGIDWGGGVYVNYVFVAVWAAETVWWGVWPAAYAQRSAAVRWTLRVFYFVIIVNAAVVFAAGWRRWLGAAIVVSLLWRWTRD